MKTTKVLTNLVMVVLSLCLVACQAAGPVRLGALETLQGLQSVIAGNPGTLIFEKGSTILMGWPVRGDYAFALVQGTLNGKMPLLNGQPISSFSFAQTLEMLKQSGWQELRPEYLPGALVTTIFNYSVELVRMGAQTLPNIFMVPLYLPALAKPTGVAQ